MSVLRPILLFSATLSTVVAFSLGAHARPDTRSYTCEGAQDFIDGRGAVTMSTGANTFARFVRSTRNCQIQEVARPAYVPTKDERQCRVLTCGGRSSSDGNR